MRSEKILDGADPRIALDLPSKRRGAPKKANRELLIAAEVIRAKRRGALYATIKSIAMREHLSVPTVLDYADRNAKKAKEYVARGDALCAMLDEWRADHAVIVEHVGEENFARVFGPRDGAIAARFAAELRAGGPSRLLDLQRLVEDVAQGRIKPDE